MKIPFAVLVISLLGGCAASSSTTPAYDLRFGDAVREARLRMTLNPSAGTNSGPTPSMDGRSVHEAFVRYQDSFKAPPPVVNVINIGGSSSAGQ